MNCERCEGRKAVVRDCSEGHGHILCSACHSGLFSGPKKPVRCPGYDPESEGDESSDEGPPL